MKKTGLFLLLLASGIQSGWAAPVIIHQPHRDAEAGKPVLITAAITDPAGQGIKQAKVYVRSKGTLGYWPNPMSARGSQYSVSIPGKLVLTAGIEYYIEVRDSIGATTTSPTLNPTLAPHFINVIGHQGGPRLELLSPDDGALILPEEAVIVIGLDAGHKKIDLTTLKFYFDEQDVTAQVNQTSTMLSFVAPENLAPGLHGIRVEVKDSDGALGKSPTWSIRIKSKDQAAGKLEKKALVNWQGRVCVESQLSLLTREPETATLLRQPEGFLNRLKVNLNGEADDWRFIGQADISSEETPGQQSVNRFQGEVYNPYLSIKLGDIYPVFSEFSLYNYFVRGGGLKLLSGQKHGAHSELSVVGGMSRSPIEGREFHYGTSVAYDSEGTFEQWLFGSRWDYEFLPGTGLALNYSSVNDSRNSIATPAGAAPRLNHVLAGEGKLKIFFLPDFTTSLFGEYGLDYNDEGQSLASLSFGDAWRAANRWEWQGNSFVQIEYRRVGAKYVSLSNPWLIADWQGFNSDAQINLLNNNLSLLVHIESWQDNLDGQKNIEYFDTQVDPQGVTISAKGTRTTAVQGSINYRIAPAIQTLFAQFAYNKQADESEPVHLVNNQALVLAFGATLLFPIANNQLIGSLTYTLNNTDNLADYRQYGDLKSETFTMAAQYLLGTNLVLSGGFGYTQMKENNANVQLTNTLFPERLVDQSSFNFRGDWKLLPGQLDLSGTIDWLGQKDDISSINEQVTTLSLGGTYCLPHNQNIMMTLSQITVDDKINDKSDYGEFIIDLRYGIGF